MLNIENSHIKGDQRGPHLALGYPSSPGNSKFLDDACDLLLHHVRRQSSISNEDKRKIKRILKHFIPDLFSQARMELSDDEDDGDLGMSK